MTVSVAYDITRLLLRSFSSGPNGIDRVDICLARHFLSVSPANRGIVLNRLATAVVGSRVATAAVDAVEAAWSDGDSSNNDLAYQTVRREILSPNERALSPRGAPAAPRRPSRTQTAARLALSLLPPFAMPKSVPKGSVFLHATHFPDDRLFRWLDRRRDVKPLFFIHDLLPVHFPDLFTERNVSEHGKFLDIFLRYGHAAIVNTEAVKRDVEALMAARQVGDKRILVAPMPAAPVFARTPTIDPQLRARPYFVICGTIEPRKNHKLLLSVWAQLVRDEGAAAPILVIAGRRGWKNEDVFRALDGATPALSHIIESPGLTSAGIRDLVVNARGLLIPSIAEGYGLPIVEALAARAPVIASDIAVFRETGGERIAYCKPDNVSAWLSAVKDYAGRKPPRETAQATSQADNAAHWKSYFSKIDGFIDAL